MPASNSDIDGGGGVAPAPERDIKSFGLNQLQTLILRLGGKGFHAGYLFRYIHGEFGGNLDDVTTLSNDLRRRLLDEGYYISCLKTIERFGDPDGTVKYLFETRSGNRFESVLLDDGGRLTLCISSQCGCRMGCRFCATAGIGFKENLTAGQIVDQVYRVQKDAGRISNVVFMGMGEPFDNLENSITAADILNDSKGLNIGARHITLSTCGVLEGIGMLAGHKRQYRLAVSLHAARDHVRAQLMPINNRYPLKELLKSVRNYQRRTQRRVTFEYCMIDGVNDSPTQARELGKLVKEFKCNVNIIEFNAFAESDFIPSSRNKIATFTDILLSEGVEAHVRFKRGQSIKAACGQLGAGWLKK